jgi:hypothetical protein
MLAGFATVSAGAEETTTIDLGDFTFFNSTEQVGWYADGKASVGDWQTSNYLVIELNGVLENENIQIIWWNLCGYFAPWNPADFLIPDISYGDKLVISLTDLANRSEFLEATDFRVLIGYYYDDVVNIVSRAYLVFGELDLGDNGGGNNNPGIGGDGDKAAIDCNGDCGGDCCANPVAGWDPPIGEFVINTPDAPFEIEGIILPKNSIVITFDTHGEFGFDFEVVVSAEQLAEAGLDAEKVKLWYISDKNEISEVKDAIVVNADGSITITVSHASYYVLAETAPEVDENPPTGVAVSFAAVLIAGGIAAVTRKRR